MGKLFRNYSYNLAYQLFSIVVPLITAPYLTRTLGAEGTGIYSYVNSTAVLISSIVMLGIYSYGNRQVAYVRDNREQLTNVFWSIMTTRLTLGLIGTIIYAGMVLLLGRYVQYFFIYYTYMLAYFLDCTWIYVGVEDMKWAVIKNFITKLISVVGIFMFVKGAGDTWKYVLLLGSSVLISNILAFTQLPRYVNKPRLSSANVIGNIKGSAYLFLPSLAATIYLQCDKVMIELLTGETSQVAFYDYSEKIVTIPLTFITVLNAVIMPRLANEYAKKNFESISKLVNDTLSVGLFFSFPMMFGLMTIAPKLIPWYLGDQFLPTVWAIVIIAPIVITNTISGIFGTQYFTATNQVQILLKSQVGAVIANIIINAILIPKYGFYGAGVATVISSLICAVVQYIYIRKQIYLNNFFLMVVKYFFGALIMTGAICIFTNKMGPTPMTNVLQMLIGIVVYLLLELLMKDRNIALALKLVRQKLPIKRG